MRKWSLAVVFAALVAAACGAFGADQGDAATSAEEDAGGADGSPDDGHDNASGDASDGSVRDALSPCVGAEHWTCDDFDDGSVVAESWSKSIGAGAVLEVEGFPTAPSPPNVLATAAGPGIAEAQVIRARGDVAKGLRCQFDLFVESEADAAVQLAQISIHDNTSYFSVELRGAPYSITQYGMNPEAGQILPNEDTVTIREQKWTHVFLELSATATAAVKVQVADSFPKITQFDLSAIGVTAQSIKFGAAPFAASAAGWRVRYDNIVCDPILP